MRHGLQTQLIQEKQMISTIKRREGDWDAVREETNLVKGGGEGEIIRE